jgi:hypothetical protein
MRRVARPWIRSASLSVAAGLLAASGALAQAPAPRIDVASYSANGELTFPADVDRWVVLGTSLGADYAQGSFDPKNPGTIGVVQIEPTAYRRVLDTGAYPDGTMLLLTFYLAEAQSEPQLRGFVQGAMTGREIHVIDKRRFPEDGRAFFLFDPQRNPTAPLPVGNECVQCHSEHGRLNATFAQFYPPFRHLVTPRE